MVNYSAYSDGVLLTVLTVLLTMQ